ncbi:MAG: nucleoside 2-deoxyribosyltransferase [Cyanobacteria bacterium P01_H01_bin.121]
MPKRIYLAGPDVFRRDALNHAEQLKQMCNQYDFSGVFPFDAQVEPQATPTATGLEIFRQNVALMDSCDTAIANMTPFRGPSMDVGTAFEMGYLFSQKKPVFAYSEAEISAYDQRTKSFYVSRGATVTEHTDGPHGSRLEDPDQMEIENFGFADNLMMVGAVKAFGLSIEQSFEACLQAAQQYFQ